MSLTRGDIERIVKAGEQAGRLADILERMFMRKPQKTKRTNTAREEVRKQLVKTTLRNLGQ